MCSLPFCIVNRVLLFADVNYGELPEMWKTKGGVFFWSRVGCANLRRGPCQDVKGLELRTIRQERQEIPNTEGDPWGKRQDEMCKGGKVVGWEEGEAEKLQPLQLRGVSLNV